jgi:hypothetical protein
MADEVIAWNKKWLFDSQLRSAIKSVPSLPGPHRVLLQVGDEHLAAANRDPDGVLIG